MATKHISARTEGKLNKDIIENAHPGDKLADGGGLRIIITPTGGYWQYRYKHPDTKKEQTASLGVYPEVNAPEARKLRNAIRDDLKSGITPQDRKEEEEEARRQKKLAREHTFESVARAWHEDVKDSFTNEKHQYTVLRSLELHVFDELGDTPISELRRPQVTRLIKEIGKQGKWATASLLLGRINAILFWAVDDEELIEANVIAGYRLKRPESAQGKHFPAIKYQQLGELLEDFDAVRLRMGEIIALAMEMQMRTFVRPSELRNAKWTEFDIAAKEWVVPAERTKRKRPLVVPLTDQMLTVLEKLKPLSGHREHLFPGQKPRKPYSSSTLGHVLKLMGYQDKHTPHGFRSVANSYLDELGLFSKDAIEYQMNHVVGSSTERAYKRFDAYKYIEERQRIMETWNAYVDTCWNGGDNVTAFKRKTA
jgi:integrase